MQKQPREYFYNPDSYYLDDSHRWKCPIHDVSRIDPPDTTFYTPQWDGRRDGGHDGGRDGGRDDDPLFRGDWNYGVGHYGELYYYTNGHSKYRRAGQKLRHTCNHGSQHDVTGNRGKNHEGTCSHGNRHELICTHGNQRDVTYPHGNGHNVGYSNEHRQNVSYHGYQYNTKHEKSNQRDRHHRGVDSCNKDPSQGHSQGHRSRRHRKDENSKKKRRKSLSSSSLPTMSTDTTEFLPQSAKQGSLSSRPLPHSHSTHHDLRMDKTSKHFSRSDLDLFADLDLTPEELDIDSLLQEQIDLDTTLTNGYQGKSTLPGDGYHGYDLGSDSVGQAVDYGEDEEEVMVDRGIYEAEIDRYYNSKRYAWCIVTILQL